MTRPALSLVHTPDLLIPQLPVGRWLVMRSILGMGEHGTAIRLNLEDSTTKDRKDVFLGCGTADTAIRTTLAKHLNGCHVVGETPMTCLDNQDDGWVTPPKPNTLCRVHLTVTKPLKHEIVVQWYTSEGAVTTTRLHIHDTTTEAAQTLKDVVRTFLRKPENLAAFLQARELIAAKIEEHKDSPRGVSWDDDLTVPVAMVFLERNTRNRPVKTKGLVRLINDLKNPTIGPLETGDCICFHPDGTSANGQHRCIGAITTGLTIPVAFRFSLPYKSQTSQDRGTARTNAQGADQQFKGQGMPPGAAIDAMVRIMVRYEFKGKSIGPERGPFDHFITMYGDSMKLLLPFMGDPLFKLVGVRTAFLIGLNSPFRDQVLTVANQLLTGAGLNEGTAVLALQKELMKNGMSKTASKNNPATVGWVLHALSQCIQNVRPAKFASSTKVDARFRQGKTFFGSFPIEAHFVTKLAGV